MEKSPTLYFVEFFLLRNQSRRIAFRSFFPQSFPSHQSTEFYILDFKKNTLSCENTDSNHGAGEAHVLAGTATNQVSIKRNRKML